MFGERLKSILQKKNISQVKLATELDLTSPAVNRWCNGVTEPDNETIVKIANYLGVSTDYLLGNDEKISNEEQELKEKEALKKALQKAGFMKGEDDLTDEEYEKVMEFVVANKKFLKGDK